MQKIAVLGAGAWGTALAQTAAAAGRDVMLWGRDGAQLAAMRESGCNAAYLPDIRLHPRIAIEPDLARAADAQAVLLVVPAQAMRALLRAIAPLLPADVPLVICAKGIEQGTGLFMSDLASELCPANPPVLLSGPSFAEDVVRGLPTAVTLAARDAGLARALVAALKSPTFRLYHSTDLRGAEIGGAAKNVLAIACGMAAGKGLGASANAALIARGFAELSRFALALGARRETLMGLSGLGDLVLTCSSAQSRNYAFGFRLGHGEPQPAHGMLAEGVFTASALVAKARAHGVEMPIAEAVDAILKGAITLDEAIAQLMMRESKAEWDHE